MKVKNILEKIEEKDSIRFAYQVNQLSVNRKVSLTIENSPLQSVLEMLFDNNVLFEGKGNLVVIKPAIVVDKVTIHVSGRVTDAKTGESLPGVNVVVKGNAKAGTITITAGAITDADGKYAIDVNDENSVLIFSSIGYGKQEMTVGQRTVIDIQLAADQKSLDEVVVMGYGTQTQARMTSAVSQINGKDVELIAASSLSNALAGRLSGVFVSSSTGRPGIGSSMRIRSPSSFSNSGADPLYVIDGIVRDKTSFDALDPNEVAEVTVLKDAASAAIYGSRSSNGAILVTTKTGKSGKAVIQFTATGNMQATGKLPTYMPVSDALNLWKNVLGGISTEEINWALKNNPKGENYYNVAYKNPNSQRYALSVSGGSDKVKGYIGASTIEENGFLPQVTYKKYNLRGNIETDLVKNLTLGLNVNTSFGTNNRFNFTYDYDSPDLNNLWGKLLYWDIFATPYIDGKPNNPGWLGNPIEMMRNGGYTRVTNQQIDALLSAVYKIQGVKGLSIKATYSKNFNNNLYKAFAKKQLLYNFKKTGPNNLIYTNEVIGTTMSGDPGQQYLTYLYNNSQTYQLDGYVNYDRTFGKHTVSGTAVYEQYEGGTTYFGATRKNFPLLAADQALFTSKNNADWETGASETQSGRLSYIGRINYDYSAKYLISASVRRDGSTNFAPHKRWGWFPSVSAGWVISDEPFFQSSPLGNRTDFLKIRGSFATTGNDVLDPYNSNTRWSWQEQYLIGGGYYLGNPGTLNPTVGYGGIANSNLTWEKSYSEGVGLDAIFAKHIKFTFDYWQRRTRDILGTRILAVPNEYGASLPAQNYGKVNSNGVELELGYENSVGNSFTYNVKAMFTYAVNKVIFQDVAANTLEVDNPNGKSLSYLKGYKALGILKTQGDLNKLPAGYLVNGVTPALGDMLLADISGPNGVPDGVVNGYDQIVLGQYKGAEKAPITFGLNLSASYKGITLDVLMAGLSGYKISYNDAWSRNYGGGGKVPMYHADSWSTDNPNGSTPKLYSWDHPHSVGYTWTSTFNTYNGSFLRMKYVNLSYKLPANVLSKLGVSNLSFFLQGQNLFNITGFKLYDPEIAQFMSYPIMKSYTAGLSCQF